MGTARGADQLSVEVRRLKTRSGRRRTLPRLLHVGDPAGARLVVPLDGLPVGDRGLAADLLTRALDRMGDPDRQQVWVTRAGLLAPEDDDWRWRTGTSVARARRDRAPGAFYVVTRHGWLELPSGVSRSWQRMRACWRAPYGEDRPDPVTPDPLEGWPIVV